MMQSTDNFTIKSRKIVNHNSEDDDEKGFGNEQELIAFVDDSKINYTNKSFKINNSTNNTTNNNNNNQFNLEEEEGETTTSLTLDIKKKHTAIAVIDIFTENHCDSSDTLLDNNQQQLQIFEYSISPSSPTTSSSPISSPIKQQNNKPKRKSGFILSNMITKANLISSIEVNISNTVEFDYKNKKENKKYVGYVMDIVIGYNNDSIKVQWQTIRRYNEFKKLHYLLKKNDNFSEKSDFNKEFLLKEFKFPSKNVIASYNDVQLLEFRRKIFNDYLKLIVKEFINNLNIIKPITSIILYFLDIHNSQFSFLFEYPFDRLYLEHFKKEREEKRRLKRFIEIEKNYDEEKEKENGQFLLREQEWYEEKFNKIETLTKQLNEIRLRGDEFYIEMKGNPFILCVDRPSSSLLFYSLNIKDNVKVDQSLFRQVFIDEISMVREINNTFRGDGFELINIQLLNSLNENIEFYAFDRKEIIFTIGAHINQYKQAKAKLINYLSNTTFKLKKERYDETNELHEKDILLLYSLLRPEDPLTNRKSKQWTHIGFQQDNPSSDIRGGGLLSVKCLLYFAQHDTEGMKKLIAHNREYPFCVSGINVSHSLCTMIDLENLANGNCVIETIEDKFPLFRFMVSQIKNGTYDAENIFGQLFIVFCNLLDKIFVDDNAGYMMYQTILEKTKQTLAEVCKEKRPIDLLSLKQALGL
ncbi:hypothetical protein ABK040_005518 [Willaertia magna]